MDASAGRCFLEVYRDGCDEPRLLQLEPTVKFHNVLKVFERAGDLYWGGHRIDPQTTPADVGMSYGVDKANTLRFIQAPPCTKLCGVSRVDSTTPLDSPLSADVTVGAALCPGRGTSLPAYFDDHAGPPQRSGHNAVHSTLIGARMTSVSATPPPSWYYRPLLLSPVPPPLPQPDVTGLSPAEQASFPHRATLLRPHSVRAVRQLLRKPTHTATDGVATTGAPMGSLESHGDEPIARIRHLSAAPHAQSPPHAAAPTRRNTPVFIDPHILVDPASDAVETLQTELRLLSSEVRAMQHRDRLNSNPVTTTQPSVEELAVELHDKQMHRLYEQRRFYLHQDLRA